MSDLHTGFQKAAASESPEAMFQFLDAADKMAQVQQAKQIVRDALMPRAGQEFLDVGSGLGHEVQRLAQLVGSTGRVVGIDANPAMVAEATRRAAHLDLPITIEHGDGEALRFADGSFDGSRAERVLMYVPQPERVIAELARVVRSGGRVAVFDFDYGSILIDGPDEKTARQVQAILAASVPNGTVGRRLARYFRAAGLVDVSVEPYPIQLPYPLYQRLVATTLRSANARGEFADAALASWSAAMAEANARGEFFALFLGMIATGRKP